MKKIFLLVLLIALSSSKKILVSQDEEDNDFAGGIFPTQDSNSDTYNQALQFAQKNFALQCNLSDYQWESLNGSKNQMVQGILYYFNVTLKGNSKQEQYEIQVWIQLDGETEITNCKKL